MTTVRPWRARLIGPLTPGRSFMRPHGPRSKSVTLQKQQAWHSLKDTALLAASAAGHRRGTPAHIVPSPKQSQCGGRSVQRSKDRGFSSQDCRCFCVCIILEQAVEKERDVPAKSPLETGRAAHSEPHRSRCLELWGGTHTTPSQNLSPCFLQTGSYVWLPRW